MLADLTQQLVSDTRRRIEQGQTSMPEPEHLIVAAVQALLTGQKADEVSAVTWSSIVYFSRSFIHSLLKIHVHVVTSWSRYYYMYVKVGQLRERVPHVRRDFSHLLKFFQEEAEQAALL